MAGPALDSLADSLLPDAMEAKTQTDKAKVMGINRVQFSEMPEKETQTVTSVVPVKDMRVSKKYTLKKKVTMI